MSRCVVRRGLLSSDLLPKRSRDIRPQQRSCCIRSGENITMNVRQAIDLLVERRRVIRANGKQHSTRELDVLLTQLVGGIGQEVWRVATGGVAIPRILVRGVVGVAVPVEQPSLDVTGVVDRGPASGLVHVVEAVRRVVAKLRTHRVGTKLLDVAMGVVLGLGDVGIAATDEPVGVVVTEGSRCAIDRLTGAVAVLTSIRVQVSTRTATCVLGAETIRVGITANGCRGEAVDSETIQIVVGKLFEPKHTRQHIACLASSRVNPGAKRTAPKTMF